MSDRNNFSALHPRHLYYTPDSLRSLHTIPDVERFEWQVEAPEEATCKTVICRDPEQGRVLFRSTLPNNLREAMLMGFILGKSAGYFEGDDMYHYVMNADEAYVREGYGAYDPDTPPISEAEDHFKDQTTPQPEPDWSVDEEDQQIPEAAE